MNAADNNASDDSIEGHVEQLDELFGVGGWAIDRDRPAAALNVELWAGDALLATTTTGLARQDVSESLDLRCNPGFRFEDDVRGAIREAAGEGGNGELVVRVAGRTRPLASLAPSRSLDYIRLTGLGGAPGNRDALIDRLSHHARAARATFDQPLRPMPGHGVGFIEAIATDDSGVTWVIGWMMDDVVFDRPMVILDNGKHAAGMAYATYARDDLPPGSIGFVGIVHTDWRASSELLPYFFLADGSARYLEALQPTPIRTRAAIAPLVRDLLAKAQGGFQEILRELFHTVHSWALVSDPHAKDLLRVDEVAILPGFGAFVKGWSLSPSKEAERYVLKAGNRIMVAEDRTVSKHYRPDLAAIYPNAALAIESAGFTALFRGDFDGARLDDMILKVAWSDGSATNESIDADKTRVLGLTAALESVSIFYPAIESEAFFPDFARHAASFTRGRARQVRTYESRAAPAAMVLVAPPMSSDVFLMFDAALRHAATLPNDWGIAILARPDNTRPLIVSLFADLKRVSGRACSLFFVGAADAASEALVEVLGAIGAERFGYCGARAVLTGEGWRAAATARAGLTLLEIADLTVADGGVSAGLDAFACDTASWRRIAAEAPARIGGIVLETVPEAYFPTERAAPGGAIALSIRRSSPLVARINAIDGAAHG